MPLRVQIQIFVCDPWESYMRDLELRHDREWEDHQHELALEDVDTLQGRELEFFEMREAVDPYWPPPELDQFEECEPDLALEARP